MHSAIEDSGAKKPTTPGGASPNIKGPALAPSGTGATSEGENDAQPVTTTLAALGSSQNRDPTNAIPSIALTDATATEEAKHAKTATEEDAKSAEDEKPDAEGEKPVEAAKPAEPAGPKTNDEQVQQIISMKEQFPDNIAVQCFDKAYYDTIETDELKTRFLKCLDSGRENGSSGMGCYANSPDDYETFKPFFKAALQKYHNVNLDKKSHINNWSLEGVEGLPESGVLDLAELGLPALSMRVRTDRIISTSSLYRVP